jgi:small subunit ribosomal protein S9
MTDQNNTPAPEEQAPAATEPPAAPENPTATSEATATAEAPATPAPVAAPKPSGPPPDGHWWWGTGRRKAAVARVRIRPGEGKFEVNKRPHDEFFTEIRDRNDITNVLKKTNTLGSVDVHVNVHGGGYTGQAGAIVLGLARALRRYDASLEPILRDNAFLTRDPRKVERKKYGQPGARKRFQFSKR